MSESEGSSHEAAPVKERSKGTKRSKSESTKRKTKRPKKDKDAPKRAKTAFIIYSSAKRPELKKTAPTLTFADIGRRLAEMWRGESAEEKQHFEQRAAEDKVRYDREKRAYEQTKGKDEKKTKEKPAKKSKKSKKDKRKHDSESESGSDSESSGSGSGSEGGGSD